MCLSDIKKGDSVWSPLYGYGIVSVVRVDGDVCVDFKYDFMWYYLDGTDHRLTSPPIYKSKPEWWVDVPFCK